MKTALDREHSDEADGRVEFFGFELRVHNPRLAALLAGDEDVRVECRGTEPVVAAAESGDRGVSWRTGRQESGGEVVQLRRPAPGY
jgi:hypothetical protein